MNKKLISQVINKNLSFLVFSILTTLYFMRDVNQALYTPNDMGPLTINSVGYTLFNLKIDVIHGSFHNLYIINNYPLIPLLMGIIYNIYILVKIYRNKDK